MDGFEHTALVAPWEAVKEYAATHPGVRVVYEGREGAYEVRFVPRHSCCGIPSAEGYLCTEPVNHDDLHVACDESGRILRTWA